MLARRPAFGGAFPRSCEPESPEDRATLPEIRRSYSDSRASELREEVLGKARDRLRLQLVDVVLEVADDRVLVRERLSRGREVGASLVQVGEGVAQRLSARDLCHAGISSAASTETLSDGLARIFSSASRSCLRSSYWNFFVK